jgi:hypothetical protein
MIIYLVELNPGSGLHSFAAASGIRMPKSSTGLADCVVERHPSRPKSEKFHYDNTLLIAGILG